MITLLLACSEFQVTPPEVAGAELVLDAGTAGPVALDLIAIVDESASMGNELDTIVSTTLPLAVSNLLERDVLDWRVVLRTADETTVDAYGEVWRDDEDPEAAIAALFGDLALRGYSRESGLGAAALSMVHDGHRPQAVAVFWVVSDEHDQSRLTSPEVWLQQAATFKAAPYTATLTATVYGPGDDLWCNGSHGELGTGYLEAADQWLSLCEPDEWPGAIVRAADEAEAVNARWPLSRVPVNPFEVEVYVDGVRETAWTWDGGGNRVILDEPAAPGQDVVIGYLATPAG
jgi:hypothetical protein